jgi:hypothetical protein
MLEENQVKVMGDDLRQILQKLSIEDISGTLLENDINDANVFNLLGDEDLREMGLSWENDSRLSNISED